MLIFGYWVKTILAVCRFAAILPVMKNCTVQSKQKGVLNIIPKQHIHKNSTCLRKPVKWASMSKHHHSIHTHIFVTSNCGQDIPVVVSLLTRRPSTFLSCCSLSIKSSRCCEPVLCDFSCFLLSSHCDAKLSRSWNISPLQFYAFTKQTYK